MRQLVWKAFRPQMQERSERSRITGGEGGAYSHKFTLKADDTKNTSVIKLQ